MWKDKFEAARSLFNRLARFAVWVGGCALFVAALMVSADVVCRKFFNLTIGGSDEISGYVFAAATAWAFPYCLLHRANVRIDVAYNLLEARPRAISDLLGLLLLSIFVSVLAYYAGVSFLETWSYGSVSTTSLQVPLWIPQGIWVTGLLFLLATCCFLTVYIVLLLIGGHFEDVARVAGIPSVSDVIGEETVGLDLRKGYPESEGRQS